MSWLFDYILVKFPSKLSNFLFFRIWGQQIQQNMPFSCFILLTHKYIELFIQSIITLSLKIMSCPAVSCSKCVSGDVNWLRPCANSHFRLTKGTQSVPLYYFHPQSVFVLEHRGNVSHSQEQCSGFSITQPLLYLHTGYRRNNCVSGIFFPFF